MTLAVVRFHMIGMIRLLIQFPPLNVTLDLFHRSKVQNYLHKLPFPYCLSEEIDHNNRS